MPEGTESILRRLHACMTERADSVAVVCDGVHLSYGALHERANGIARALRACNVGRETPVGLLVDRSVDAVVGIVGILTAGAAYVPLDPGYPAERLDWMVADSECAVVLSVARVSGRVPARATVRHIDDAERWTSATRDERSVDIHPEQLAYIIYTSGSSGRPKGVAVSHRNLRHSIGARDAVYRAPVGHYLLLSSWSFDSSVAGIFWTLSTGGTLHLPREGAQADVVSLRAQIAREGITHTLALPSLYAALADAPDTADSLASLQVVIVAGERCDASVVRAHDRILPHAALFNEYGPTEATVWATVYNHSADQSARTVPIGRPIPESRAYLMDGAEQLTLMSAAGELYVGGPGVARGYWRQPRLTAERFVPDTLSDQAGARTYRTGDRARWRSDGQLEFLGRRDDQVKLRGHRIELGEIEATLRTHLAVLDAAAAVCGTEGHDQVVAYWVARDGSSDDGRALRAWLQARLPPFMIPSRMRAVASLPRTPNGKLDRASLPPIDSDRGAGTKPRSAIEEVVSAMYAQVLKRDEVGATDHFFELGGHSLLATQLVARLRHVFQVDVTLQTLFEAPTVDRLAQQIERLQRETNGRAVLPIVPVPRSGPVPLSFAQERLWFLHQLEPDSAAYHVAFALQVNGNLDYAALRHAVAALVERHEVLRTTFAIAAGEPVQVVHVDLMPAIGVVDLELLAGRDTVADALVRAEARRPFNLERGPLVRIAVVRFGAGNHLLVVTAHHIVSDGWSLAIWVDEFAALYRAACRGEPASLPPLPVQYADYAVWQRRWLVGAVLDGELAYWRKELDGVTAVSLPVDRRLRAATARTTRHVTITLDSVSRARLVETSRRLGATPFMVLLAICQLMLTRYADRRDVIVGVPVAGRTQHAIERLIGFFVNTLVLRGCIDRAASFVETVGRVRRTVIEAHLHQELPFEKIVEAVAPARDGRTPPLLHVLFGYQAASSASLDLEPLSWSLRPAPVRTAKVDLSITWREARDGLQGVFTYVDHLFDPRTISRFAEQFVHLLKSALAAPDLPVSDLPLMTAAARRDLLTCGNDTAGAFENTLCVHAAIRRRAREVPERVAIVFGDQHVSYEALIARADALAARLRRRGVGPGERAAVHVRRSIDMVIAILGVLEAGGAYVPLDPTHPPVRLAFIAKDAAPAAIVTDAAGLDLPEVEVPLVRVDADEPILATSRPAANEPTPSPRDVCYVMYTSGSTGRPKGVEVQHRSVMNLLTAMAATPGLAECDVVLATTTLAFDIAVAELLLPLFVGARVVLTSADVVYDPAAVRSIVESHGVTVMQATPSRWQLYAAPEWTARHVRLWCGGEAMTVDLARTLTTCSEVVWNLYGPTETTVWSTAHRLDGAPSAAPSLGEPLLNTTTYVLDYMDDVAPIGAIGELCIGGEGVARGYAGRARLTAERFVPDPFATVAGARIYRTGDLVRRLDNGTLVYVGRADTQLKIRGHRVELGEIEAALRACTGTKEVAVVATSDAQDTRVVAYVVGDVEDAGSLRRAVQETLPRHMVPDAFVMMERLPLTPSGKLDRSALPAFELDRQAFVGPHNETERRLLAIWEDVLGTRGLSVLDDFFAVGGHSFAAVRLMSRIGEEFGHALPISVLFEAPSVEMLARHVDRERISRAPHRIVAIQPAGVLPAWFCVHPVGGEVWCCRELAKSLGVNRPFYAIQAPSLVDLADSPEFGSVQERAAAYLDLIRDVQPHGPYLLAGCSIGGLVSFEMARQLTAVGETVAVLALFDTMAPERRARAEDDVAIIASLARGAFFRRVEWSPNLSDLAALPPEARYRAILDDLRRTGIVPPTMDDQAGCERVRRIVSGYQRRLDSFADYQPAPYDGVVTLVRADGRSNRSVDLTAGWSRYTTQPPDVVPVDGDHEALYESPHVEVIAAALQMRTVRMFERSATRRLALR